MARIYLSPPDVDEASRTALLRAFDSGWIAPLGPEVDAFEEELAARSGRSEGVALASGTAALHLALIGAGVGPGDFVAVQSLTFSATANPVIYVGATPVFVDSTDADWNMDPVLLEQALADYAAAGTPIKAVMPVDLYGQCADYDRIVPLCERYEAVLIEDAAEALGASYHGKLAGSFGAVAALSFNGNKIITTSGGGALVVNDAAEANRYRFLATQARDPAPHYQHSELGFNYRLSNLLAALGRAQLADLDRRIEIRRGHNAFYQAALGDLAGLKFMPEPEATMSNRWLTTLTIDPQTAPVDREAVRLHLESLDIEARPVWKPMHLQPFFASAPAYVSGIGDNLFAKGLCLPSGSTLTEEQRTMIATEVSSLWAK